MKRFVIIIIIIIIIFTIIIALVSYNTYNLSTRINCLFVYKKNNLSRGKAYSTRLHAHPAKT